LLISQFRQSEQVTAKGAQGMGNKPVTASMAVLTVVLFGSASATETAFVETAQAGRFVVLETFHGQAVLDRTTQLIWERSPHPTEVTWATATTRCTLKTVGGQTGWRLPSFIELMTLVEPPARQTSAAPALPPHNPFQGVKADAYWTNDALSSDPAQAYTVDLFHADVAPHQKNQAHPLWCVREGIAEHPPQIPATQSPGLI
jgi:hypothetical protein